MLRDTSSGGASYKVGFGAGNVGYRDPNDQEGPSPKSGFINKALYGHPVMRFFTLATGTMVGMHFAGKMVQRGGMKLGTQLFENDFGKDWQKRLLKDYRDVQRTLDTWERGIHRTPHPDHPDNPLKDIITRDVSAGFYHDYETRRRAAIIGDVLPHEEWTFRDELKQRLIRQARRLPYDLPAAWIAQRAVVDPITGQRDNEPRWSSPMSVIGNFANTSAKNLLGLLLPFQAAGAGLSQGWRRAMTFGDTAVPKTGFERFGRHASLTLDAMLRQVGQDASQMLYNMSKLSAKSTGALGAGINEAIDQNKHIVDHLHQARRSSFPNSLSPEMGGGGERDMKVAALATSRWVASRFLNRLPFQSLYRGATDYWHEFDYRMMHREAWLRGEQEFTFAGAKERTFQFRGKPLQYPTPGGWKDVRLGSSERIFNSGGERITLVPGQRIHTDSNLAYFPHAERTEAERIAGSLYGLQGAGPGSRSWFKGDFYRGVVRTEYSKLAEKELADGITRARTAGKGLAPADITKISDEAQTAARAFMQRTNIGYLPGRELSKTPIQEAINRIKFGEGVSYKFEKPRTEWEADLYGRLKNVPVPEIQSHANYIAGEITGAVRRADELFIDQRETINARIEHQWKRLYSEALVPAVRSNFDLRPSRLARGAFIGESLDEESYDFLLRKTAITAGFELKRNTEQEAVRQMLQSRGFDPTNVGQLRAFLTHKGVLSPPWSGRGFNALGLRALSIEKALDTRFFSQRHVGEIRRLVTSISKTDPLDVRRTAVGSGVFETASGQILDLSPLYSAGRRLLNAASTKLQLPILRFNPLQMLGYGANRELAEGDPIQYLPGKSRQIFVGEGGGDNDAFLWIRQHRARGRLFKINTDTAEVAGKPFFNSDVKQVGDSLVSLYPTERWGMLGRSVRLAAGEKGLSPRKTPSRLGRMFDLDSDQPASGLDKVRRFRNRKDDLDYFATFARKLHEGFPEYANKRDMPQMGSRVAHGLDLFDQYLRRFTMPQPLIRSLEGEVQGTSLENLFRFSSGKSVSSIRHIEDLERATREQLASDADAVSLGESKVALSRAQSTIWRHLNKADSQRYFTKGTGFTFQKAGISTRADQFRADIYRYLAMRQHIIDVEAGVGEDPITELMNKLASMRGRGLMSQKDYSVARAAVANYQMSFLSQRYWSLHATDQERSLRVFEDLRVDSRFKDLWKAVSHHHLAPDMPLREVRKWLKGTFGLGYSDYEYPGTVYNPFGSRVVAVNRPGTLFRKDARRFLRHVGGDKTWSDPEFFSGASVPVSHFFQRLNRFWSMFGLQIDEQPYRGPLSFYGIGMTGKRILPIYAAGATGIMLDRELGGQLNPRDQNGQKVYSPYVLGHLAAIPAYGEVLAAGVTGGRQGMQDKYQQIFQGEVPIRRGRFWSLGNTPYFGSRVMYYRPSWYRRLRSGYKYTQEDWHTPLQQWLYGYDFSPLRVLNPYKWEQMHYQDRPYPVTGEYFTGPWGPMTSALNLTIGRILKPPTMMHRDDLQAGLAAYSPIGQYGVMSPSPAKDRSNFLLRQTSGGQFGVFIPRTGADYIGRGAEGTRLIPMGGMGNGSGRHARAVLGQLNEYYVTNAGSPAINSSYNPPVTVVPSPTTQDETRRSMVNAHQIILLTQPRIMGPRVLPNAPVLAQSGFQNTLAQYGYEQQELWGIYGFAFGAVREASGVSNQNFSTTRPVLESASRAYGSERAFWDLNLGGLGDIPSVGSENIEISEIVRRFIPHRRRELNTINPIPNTYINQYPWLPHGGDYFQDYGLGDPFCLSGSSLVEVGDLDFIRADEVKLHDQLVDTFGDATTVNRLAIRNPEPLFRLTFATLPAWPIECTPDHPIVTRTLVKGRDNKVRVKLYKDANMLLKEVQNGGTRCDMADRAGLRYGRATAAWTLLEKHHKVNIIRNGQRGIVEVLDAEPFDEELLDKGLLFVRADELKVGDYVAYPKPKFRETTQQLDLAEIGDWKSCTHDYVYSSCSYETALDWELVLDGKGKGSGQKECLSRVKYRFRKGIRPRRYPRYMYLTKDLGIFLGMWCAEGVADSFGRIGTAHHIDEKGIVESIYRRLGFNPNIYRRSGKGIYAEIHSKPLALFLKYVCRGKDARSKEVNSEFVGYPEEFIKGFLEGLFFGDGSRFKDANRTVTSLRTSSWKLALQVRKLLLSFGMMSSIIWNAPSECDFLHESGQLQHIEGGESWTLKISGEAEDFYGCQWFSDDQFFYLRLRKIEEIDSQETYGFTTDTHTFCAVGVATHNTGGSGGTLMEGEMRLPGPGYERLNRLHPDQYGQYGLLDRYSVLADVAPWSDEFRAYNQMVTRMAPNLPPEDQQFIQTIKDQVTEVKKRHNWFPYQYARQSFQTESVRVGHVVPGHPEMFVSSKDPDHPIRLAGVRSASTPQAQAFMENILQPGAKVEVTWDANQPSFSSSKEQTIDAIVKVNNMSVNQMLMNSPYAQPSRSTQPIDVKATTSALSYRFHAMIETLAHRNTLLNTKFWQRRTPIEDWERANIYGATFPQWNAPIQDFIKPMFYRSANRNPITAAAVLGFVGSMFGSNPRSKAALGVAGGMAGFFTSLFTNARTVQTGERFIPKYRQQQMAVEEDADVLNYVKYLSLYNRYRIAAAREEGQDPEELAEESEREGRSNKQKHVWDWEDAQVGDRPSLPESQKRYQPIGPLTAEALGFRRQMRRTMYGADPYTANIMDLSAAIPKRKRDYFMEFLNAPKSQRARILSTSPRLERRIYESRWGMQVEQRPNLNEYFSEHELPPPDWQGWSPDVSMDEVKIKVAEHMGLDLSQMGYFPQEIQEANLLNPTYPSYVIQPQSPTATTRALRQLLVGQAVGGRVQAVPTPWSGTQVQYQAGVA